MIDPVAARLIEDVAELKLSNKFNLAQIVTRLERLEAEAEQAKTDREQAERELARLRAVLDEMAE
ncbi:MAG: hypothetical protein IT306_29250 [Chloroflexi bacterium]|nr:hypothetical protein [Chloroflexota bacterium]